MNINSIKFEKIESIYTNNKQELLQNQKPKNQDILEISDLGKYLNKVNSGEEKMNLEKIIENGTYRIDSNDLAKKIIENMKGGI